MSAPTQPAPASGAVARTLRALASPAGVLIAVPLLVAAAGLVVFVLGRDATTDVSAQMARRQLADQAARVDHEVSFALDQAEPLLARLAALATSGEALEVVGPRLYDLLIGRGGVAWVSVSLPDGTFRAAYREGGGAPEVQESRVGPTGTLVRRFTVEGGRLRPLREETTGYDPRQRAFYQLAVRAGARAWTEPYPFFGSHATGVTCVEPMYDAAGALTAVLTVDFDVGAMSSFIARAPIAGARTVVFDAAGSILAYPSAAAKVAAAPGPADRPLRATDLDDPTLAALFAALGSRPVEHTPAAEGGAPPLRTLEVTAAGIRHLVSVAPIAGRRAQVARPLDWFVATMVPTDALFGPTRRLTRRSLWVSALALATAVALALAFAWHLVRMRRDVAASQARAHSAEARARELGSYRLLSRLGAGGMGDVWRAEHRLLARQAAIKMIRTDADGGGAGDGAAETRERFRREAQVLASMRSRHTIEIFDYGVADDDTFYYVMELLDGVDLDTLVRRHGAQPAARVVHFLRQACASLAEAHDAGLLHRDIKPANLITTRAADEVDVLKVLDFGLVHTVGDDAAPAMIPPVPATLAVGSMAAPAAGLVGPSTGRLTQVGTVLGTPGFMSPEQATGRSLDGRSDLYALACVAWWLLTADEVFAGPTPLVAVFNHVHQPVPTLRDRVEGWIPDGLEPLLRRCLAKDPADRPASARELADALRALTIPPEHAWTDERAQAWWRVHGVHPADEPGAAQASLAATEAARVLVPRSTT